VVRTGGIRACLRELASTATVLLLVGYTLGASGAAGTSVRGYGVVAAVSFVLAFALQPFGVVSRCERETGSRFLRKLLWSTVFALVGAAEFYALNQIKLYPVLLALMAFTLGLSIYGFYEQAKKIIEGKTSAYKPLFGNYASVFLNLVLGFAFLYVLLESWRGAALFHIEHPTDRLLDYLYLSLVTMTNLGYGDIVPLDRLAKGLVMLQSVLGFLLLSLMAGIVVARLGRKSR